MIWATQASLSDTVLFIMPMAALVVWVLVVRSAEPEGEDDEQD